MNRTARTCSTPARAYELRSPLYTQRTARTPMETIVTRPLTRVLPGPIVLSPAACSDAPSPADDVPAATQQPEPEHHAQQAGSPVHRGYETDDGPDNNRPVQQLGARTVTVDMRPAG